MYVEVIKAIGCHLCQDARSCTPPMGDGTCPPPPSTGNWTGHL